MADRKLNHSERGVNLFGGEKARDRADARRQMEGLNQNDQVIALLTEQNDMLARQTEVLEYMAARLHGIEAKAQTGASSSP